MMQIQKQDFYSKWLVLLLFEYALNNLMWFDNVILYDANPETRLLFKMVGTITL